MAWVRMHESVVRDMHAYSVLRGMHACNVLCDMHVWECGA